MIYFLQHKETGLIKIGVTKNYSRRIDALKNKYGELNLLGWLEGDKEVEVDLHNQFKDLNTVGVSPCTGKEWFKPDDKLIKFIINSSKPANSIKRTKHWSFVVSEVTRLSLSVLRSKYGSTSLGDVVEHMLNEHHPSLVNSFSAALTVNSKPEAAYKKALYHYQHTREEAIRAFSSYWGICIGNYVLINQESAKTLVPDTHKPVQVLDFDLNSESVILAISNAKTISAPVALVTNISSQKEDTIVQDRKSWETA